MPGREMRRFAWFDAKIRIATDWKAGVFGKKLPGSRSTDRTLKGSFQDAGCGDGKAELLRRAAGEARFYGSEGEMGARVISLVISTARCGLR